MIRAFQKNETLRRSQGCALMAPSIRRRSKKRYAMKFLIVVLTIRALITAILKKEKTSNPAEDILSAMDNKIIHPAEYCLR
jgi:hypothetical protein